MTAEEHNALSPLIYLASPYSHPNSVVREARFQIRPYRWRDDAGRIICGPTSSAPIPPRRSPAKSLRKYGDSL